MNVESQSLTEELLHYSIYNMLAWGRHRQGNWACTVFRTLQSIFFFFLFLSLRILIRSAQK